MCFDASSTHLACDSLVPLLYVFGVVAARGQAAAVGFVYYLIGWASVWDVIPSFQLDLLCLLRLPLLRSVSLEALLQPHSAKGVGISGSVAPAPMFLWCVVRRMGAAIAFIPSGGFPYEEVT